MPAGTPDFAFHVEWPSRAVALVRIAGELDLCTCPELCRRLSELIFQGAASLVIDLEGVGHMDSSGLRVLLTAFRQVRDQGGDLKVVCTAVRTLRLFRITGLNQLFQICVSAEEALAQLAAQAA